MVISTGIVELPRLEVTTETLELAGATIRKFATREKLTTEMIFFNKGKCSFQSGEGNSPNEMFLCCEIKSDSWNTRNERSSHDDALCSNIAST